MTNEQKAFSNALAAWLHSQEAHPTDAIIGMIAMAGTAIGCLAPTLETLAEGVALAQQLVLVNAMQTFEHKEDHQ